VSCCRRCWRRTWEWTQISRTGRYAA
jgi:hypothetical protein